MRIPRNKQLYDGATLHLYWRCTDHNKQYLLADDDLKSAYIAKLLGLKGKYKIKIFSFCAMDNHFHVVLQIATVKSFERFLQHAHTAFAKEVNAKLGRTGAVIENRARMTVIESEEACLRLECYVALNRWNCALQVRPEDYAFSSYRHYSGIQKDDRLDPSPGWLALGNTDEERCAEYRRQVELVRQNGSKKEIEAIEEPAPYFGSNEYVLQNSTSLFAAIQEHRKKLLLTRAERETDPVLAEALRKKS